MNTRIGRLARALVEYALIRITADIYRRRLEQ